MVMTPLREDAGPVKLTLATVDNMRRLSIVALPLVLSAAAPWVLRRYRPLGAIAAAGTAAILIFLPPSGLWEQSHARFGAYLAAHPVDPALSYRVAVKNNHEDGDFEFLRAGATLSHELFTESQRRQTFPSTDGYACLLATKRTDVVVIAGDYPDPYRASELARLADLAGRGQAQLQYSGADGTRAYTIAVPASLAKDSARDCDL
jgi:hypothetical protein